MLQWFPHFEEFYNREAEVYLSVGNRFSAKTTHQCLHMVEDTYLGQNNWLYGRAYLDDVRESCYSALKDTIYTQGLKAQYDFIPSRLEIQHKGTGARMVGVGFRDPDKIKSYNGFTRAWGEEFGQFGRSAYELLIPTLRDLAGNNSKFYGTSNYKSTGHWIYKKIVIPSQTDPKIQVLESSWELNEEKRDYYRDLLTRTYIGNPLGHQRDVVGEWISVDASLVMPEVETEAPIAISLNKTIASVVFLGGYSYCLLAGHNENQRIVHIYDEFFTSDHGELEKKLVEWKGKYNFTIYTSDEPMRYWLKNRSLPINSIRKEVREGDWGSYFRANKITSEPKCEIFLRQAEDTIFEVNEDTGGLFRKINKDLGEPYTLEACSLIFSKWG